MQDTLTVVIDDNMEHNCEIDKNNDRKNVPASPSSSMSAALFYHDLTPTGYAISCRNIETEKLKRPV